MLIGITGASGFIGQHIIDLAVRRGHELVAFSRQPEQAISGCEMRPFSLSEPPNVEGCDALIHLAGEPVVGLWTAEKKRRIVESRVQGTRRLVEAIAAAKQKPEVLVCSSGVGFYGDRGEEELTETSSAGEGFFAETVKLWEAEAQRATEIGTRVVSLRTAIVLGKKGGALAAMAPAFRLGLGGRLGSGQQWMPWIHLEDFVQLALFALENLDVRGPVNAAAPWPVRQIDFAQTLARTLRRPCFLPAPAWALRLVLREFSAELLDSKRVLPASALEHGFGFRFSEIEPALKNLVG